MINKSSQYSQPIKKFAEKVKKTPHTEIVKVSEELNRPDILEATFNTLANHEFHKISEEVIREKGLPYSEDVFPKWKKWMMEEIRNKVFAL